MSAESAAPHRGLQNDEVGGLVLLAGIWGASFLFIKVALDEMSPIAIAALRVSFAAVGLLAVLVVRRGVAGVRAMFDGIEWRHAVVLSVVAAAIPFFLIAWAETRISSSLAGILNASVPLFTALIAFKVDPIGRIRGWRSIGLLIGFAGVAMAAGTDISGSPAGVLAMLVASFSYATSAHYAQRHFTAVEPVTIALTQVLVSAAMLVPLALAFGRPEAMPSAKAIASVAGLGLGGTAIAWVLYYWLVSRAGPQHAVAVTYLVPIAALFYGATLLDEHVAALAIVGVAVTIAGQAILATRSRASRLAVAERATPVS